MGLLDAFADPQFRKDVVRGLLDAGNRGAVAGLLGGPVDLATMALRPLGYNVEQPVGGSEWIGQKMQNLGLVSEKRNPLAEGLAAFAGPMAAQQIAPKVFAAELRAMENMAKPSPMNAATRGQAGAIVWHGSPHKFDKFDSSKIGTGEGAQAYGHGLYLAETPDVAAAYKNLHGGAVKKQSLIKLRDKAPIGSAEWNHYDQLAKESAGSLYKVDLPDDQIARMLDWDKPLSQQAPEVKNALSETLKKSVKPYSAVDGSTRYMATLGNEQKAFKTEKEALDFLSSNLNGGAAYLLSGQGAQSSNLLTRQGIPGIRYLDGGSRGAGTGTSNFVVFPGQENILRILERNGVPLP